MEVVVAISILRPNVISTTAVVRLPWSVCHELPSSLTVGLDVTPQEFSFGG